MCRAGGIIQRGKQPRAFQAEGLSQRGQANRTWCPQGSGDGWALVCIASTKESGSESSGELLRVWAGDSPFKRVLWLEGLSWGVDKGHLRLGQAGSLCLQHHPEESRLDELRAESPPPTQASTRVCRELWPEEVKK